MRGAERSLADERVRELLGISPSDRGWTREAFLSRIDPRDRGRIEAAMRYARIGKNRHHIEFRVTAPDGSTRWLTSIGRRAAGQ